MIAVNASEAPSRPTLPGPARTLFGILEFEGVTVEVPGMSGGVPQLDG